MASAVHTFPYAYANSQIHRPATAKQTANPQKPVAALPSTTVSLGAKPAIPLTYNASGLLAADYSNQPPGSLNNPLENTTADGQNAALADIHSARLMDIAQQTSTPPPETTGSNKTAPSAKGIEPGSAEPASDANGTTRASNAAVDTPPMNHAGQAITTIAHNPAYANLIAANYVTVAALSAESPSVNATRDKKPEVKAVSAIHNISTLI